MTKQKKPTGTSGALEITVGANKHTMQHNKIVYPSSKEDIEEYIVNNFISSANAELKEKKFMLSKPQRLAQNNIDFKVTTLQGEAYLELTEIAPINGKKRSFESKPEFQNLREKIDQVYSEQILVKSRKYMESNFRSNIFLLLYTTHYEFHLTDWEINYLRNLCLHNGNKKGSVAKS